MTARWDGRALSEGLLTAARQAVDSGIPEGGRPPSLVSVHTAGPSPYSFYLRHQARAADRAGITFRDITLAEDLTAPTLREVMRALDAEPGVDAVILEHPLPPQLGFFSAVSALRIEKDVDGVGAASLGRLLAGQPVHVPAVARGAVKLARHHGASFPGRPVTVIGRSETVGLPIALLLSVRGLGADATVTLAHSRTPDLAAALCCADVVFSCAGQPGLLNRGNVPEGAAIVDVGLSNVPDSTAPGGQRAVGDADVADLEGWARAVTPVPGGVGPVTVATLMESTVLAWDLLGRGKAL
ncbi:MAG: bifunctional 5,10-methylenetetrahydrofolate dehydrogenase/5,10-methenyltetrahydrofolate cyclohydrolase [Thermoplasmata archaeon]|nr:bifunctional 5,10-methylenetetrahydrofolate dehydrogenase/5,10-methenyltetrahydrofolate cyclohydrolase [Thermoplasmata archaeon]MCI4362561.1 bifunctional 5,10-methylenetetrahydrofolate dehydrogenase/5,10-methenyltetrahydrofolate cyclohydrolase [Thermoplasmata archaeon]